MKENIRKFIETIPTEDLFVIIDDYEQFEKTGSTGDTALRKYGEKFCENLGVPTHMIVVMMRDLANYIYRYLYENKIY